MKTRTSSIWNWGNLPTKTKTQKVKRWSWQETNLYRNDHVHQNDNHQPHNKRYDEQYNCEHFQHHKNQYRTDGKMWFGCFAGFGQQPMPAVVSENKKNLQDLQYHVEIVISCTFFPCKPMQWYDGQHLWRTHKMSRIRTGIWIIWIIWIIWNIPMITILSSDHWFLIWYS